jgi:hypothetical protein
LEITRSVEVAGDFRSDTQPLPRLRPLLELDQVQVWAEGRGLARLQELGVPARSRQELESCIHLAIWTSPPSADVLRETLERVSPQYIYLFNVPPGDEDVSAFLQHLAGMARYALNHSDEPPSLIRLAAALAQTENAVRAGLEWLVGRGWLEWQADASGSLQLQAGGQTDAKVEQRALEAVTSLLDEARAYRKFYAHCPASVLVTQ